MSSRTSARSSSNMNSASARASAGATQSVGHGHDGLVLADHALVQASLHVDELLGLALEEAGDRDAGPAPDDRGDVVLVDLLLDHRLELGLLALRELGLESRQLAVANLGDPLQVALSLGALGLHPQVVDLLGDLLDTVERFLLLRPARRPLVSMRLRIGKLPLHRLRPLLP